MYYSETCLYVTIPQDIAARIDGDTTIAFPEAFLLTLSIVSYVGVFFSLVGLIIFLLTHLLFRQVLKIQHVVHTQFVSQLCTNLFLGPLLDRDNSGTIHNSDPVRNMLHVA